MSDNYWIRPMPKKPEKWPDAPAWIPVVYIIIALILYIIAEGF